MPALLSRSLLPLAALPFVSAASLHAEPTIYRGTLGGRAIVVELSDGVATATAPIAGRYFYPPQGIDIPLDPVSGGGGKAALAEEKPCTPKVCSDPQGDAQPRPPVGARWTLTASRDGASLDGTWQAPGGKPLPIRLERAATRAAGPDFEVSPQGLANIAEGIADSPALFTQAASPYDFLKMQVALTSGNETAWGDVSFRYVTDPRTRFPYPRITRLPGDAGPANRYLESEQWKLNLGAFGCRSTQYQGLGWNALLGPAAGTLGGYDEQTIKVDYLSPTVMGWTESGSLFCGGAHPSNFTNSRTIDVRRGLPLDMSLIFGGWIPKTFDGKTVPLAEARRQPDQYTWGPDARLAAYVRQHRHKADAQTEKECGIDGLIDDNLQIYFRQGDKAVFSLENLPHAINACGGDLFEVPLVQIRAFLTPAAADYFPVLNAGR